MKMLYILNIAKRVNNFSYTSMLAAQELGIEYHIAGNWGYTSDEECFADEVNYGIHIHQINFIRSPYHPGNLTAYRQLKSLVEEEQFDMIHCNTPIGGALGRIVGKKCRTRYVLYQAHGFHFYKGAPLKNWLIYYPIERWLAHYTGALITINHEDYALAQRFHVRNNGKVYYVPGVGIASVEYAGVIIDVKERRHELGLSPDDVVLISMGDLVPRKNFKTAIKAVARANNSKIHYLVCGNGPELENLKALAESLNISNQIHFLGFRSDVKELLRVADIFLFTTLQEGLPRSMMEAMAAGLPCVVSKIRGNVDLIDHGVGGYLYKPTYVEGFAYGITELANNEELRYSMGQANINKIKEYDISVVEREIELIYKSVLEAQVT